MHALSFWMLLSFVLYLELLVSLLGKVSEISSFAKTLVKLRKAISIS